MSTSPSPSPAVDWVVVEVLCVKQGWCGGRTRYILKDAIRFLPLYGLILGEVGRVGWWEEVGEAAGAWWQLLVCLCSVVASL